MTTSQRETKKVHKTNDAASSSDGFSYDIELDLVGCCASSQTQGRGRTRGRAAESSALRSSLAESFRGAQRSGQCRKEALQKTLCAMSWPRCARTRSGTRPPRARHPECSAGKPFLDFAEREAPKGHAFLVAPARPANLADRDLPSDTALRISTRRSLLRAPNTLGGMWGRTAGQMDAECAYNEFVFPGPEGRGLRLDFPEHESCEV